jgi:hypothetical protein
MNAQKVLHILLSAVLLLTLSAIPSHAATGKKKLLLFAKNPATWAIVKNGGSGKLVYHEASGVFSLTASGLQPRSSYALVRYADAPPQGGILAKGTSDARGRLELHGVWRNWTRKFWLVAGEDVAGNAGETGTLHAWHPERYLFEEKPLGIPCNCPEPEEP